LGYTPTYHITEPQSNGWDTIWTTPIECVLPDGYSVAECVDGSMQLYDAQDQRVEIEDDHGHPAILECVRYNKRHKPYGVYTRLDKAAQ
jgi:hypothetical protein